MYHRLMPKRTMKFSRNSEQFGLRFDEWIVVAMAMFSV